MCFPRAVISLTTRLVLFVQWWAFFPNPANTPFLSLSLSRHAHSPTDETFKLTVVHSLRTYISPQHPIERSHNLQQINNSHASVGRDGGDGGRPLLLLLLSLLLSSSSPLCRVFIVIVLRQTMSLGNTVLQLFCCYYSWCLYRQFQC